MLQVDYDLSSWLDGLTDESPFWAWIADFCARWLLLLFFGGAVLFLLRQGSAGVPRVIGLLLTLAAAYTIALIIAYVVRRKRPYEVSPDAQHLTPWLYTPSFPSSHAVAAFVIASFLTQWVPFPIWAVVGIFGIAATIAIARVMVGVHYFTDIIAGAVIGLLANQIFLILLFRLISHEFPL